MFSLRFVMAVTVGSCTKRMTLKLNFDLDFNTEHIFRISAKCHENCMDLYSVVKVGLER